MRKFVRTAANVLFAIINGVWIKFVSEISASNIFLALNLVNLLK